MKTSTLIFIFLLNSLLAAAQFTEPDEVPNGSTLTEYANVISVKATGKENNWTISVTLESPDLGCEQYADWWEILDENGDLIYRRILAHSHVNEQPFTRSSLEAVSIEEDQEVWIRAHMNNSGYGGQVLSGSPKSGFKKSELTNEWDQRLERTPPLPKDCRF